MTPNIKVVVPNLDCRPDRWRLCLHLLRELGYPDGEVIRVSAHDGHQYPDAVTMREDAKTAFGGRLPEYLTSQVNNDPYNYGWHWTWYDMLDLISTMPHTTYALTLIDDYVMKFSHSEVLSHLRCLLDKGDVVNILQYAQTNRPEGHLNTSRSINTEQPTTIYNKVISSGDQAVLFHPVGASAMLTLASNFPGRSPEVIFKELALDRYRIPGTYSIEFGAYPVSTYQRKQFNVGHVQDRMLRNPEYLERLRQRGQLPDECVS